jgi:hypothetical protein
MHPRVDSILLGLIAALLLVACGGQASTIRVPQDAPSIQEGLTQAAFGDTVVVSCGVYNETDLLLPDGVCLTSETGTADCVTIDAQQAGRIMDASSVGAATRVVGVSFTGGYTANGGAVQCDESFVTFEMCEFINNEATHWGGAVDMWQGSPQFVTCRFSSNYSADGGGAAMGQTTSPLFQDCLFEGNSTGASGGGAKIWWYSASQFLDCVFVQNHADTRGGGLSLFDPNPNDVAGCVFVGNTAGTAAGGVELGSWVETAVHECTFAFNAAPLGGCMSFGYEAVPTVTNCILAFSSEGGAVHCYEEVLPDPVFEHCCVHGNADGDELCGTVLENLSANPLFCAGADDVTLCADSPCAGFNPWDEQIGAHGVGCGPCATPVEASSWGCLKALYR